MKKIIILSSLLILVSCGVADYGNYDEWGNIKPQDTEQLPDEYDEEFIQMPDDTVQYTEAEEELDERMTACLWGNVEFIVFNNYNHTNAIIIKSIYYSNIVYRITQGIDKDWNSYLTNACAGLLMTSNGWKENNVFGWDRDHNYRMVFHRAENLIINE